VFPVFGDQPSPQLVDFRRSISLRANLSRCFQNQFFFRSQQIAHRLAPLACRLSAAGFFGGAAGAWAAAAGTPASSRRYFVTLRLCSSSVAEKKCPPSVLATKYK